MHNSGCHGNDKEKLKMTHCQKLYDLSSGIDWYVHVALSYKP